MKGKLLDGAIDAVAAALFSLAGAGIMYLIKKHKYEKDPGSRIIGDLTVDEFMEIQKD